MIVIICELLHYHSFYALNKNQIMTKTLFSLFILLFGFTGIINAQDSGSDGDFSKLQFRLRAIDVIPNESATIEAIGGDVELSSAIVPELDITYFFTPNWSAELILGTTKHDVTAVGTAAGDLDLGSVKLLPPTLTGQYHFGTEGFIPYLGAGLNMTLYYGVDEGPVADNVEYATSIGYAFQGGFDYMLNDKWFINVDVKRLFLSTTATVDATTALGATVDADVDIHPWIFGIGFGMKM